MPTGGYGYQYFLEVIEHLRNEHGHDPSRLQGHPGFLATVEGCMHVLFPGQGQTPAQPTGHGSAYPVNNHFQSNVITSDPDSFTGLDIDDLHQYATTDEDIAHFYIGINTPYATDTAFQPTQHGTRQTNQHIAFSAGIQSTGEDSAYGTLKSAPAPGYEESCESGGDRSAQPVHDSQVNDFGNMNSGGDGAWIGHRG